jgi:amidase, hydantoinase/carbamoylase family
LPFVPAHQPILPMPSSNTALAQRVLDWADALAEHTDEPGRLTCAYLTPAHRATADRLHEWMLACGFDSVRRDAVGNVIGRYDAAPGAVAPALVATGSHYDTVRNGGRYDGRLGILAPMAVVAGLHAEGRRLAFDLEVVGFAEEEGLRFGGSFMGSSAYAGCYDTAMLDLRDRDGVILRQAMLEAGLDPARIPQAAVDARRLRHYFEIHIEQGPVLLERGLALGVVTGIAGCVRRHLVLEGQAGHAGTTPMDMRRDAAAAAAEIVLAVERRCSGVPGLVGTVGMLEVPGGSVNVIPGRCELSLDVRAGEDAVRDAALVDLEREIAAICERRRVAWRLEEVMRAAAVPCSEDGRRRWRDALQVLGHEPFELPSGAGHDAMVMARVAPISMLFVRCGNGGVSHNPAETITAEDVEAALSAARRFLEDLDQSA